MKPIFLLLFILLTTSAVFAAGPPDPKFNIGEHVTITVSGDEAMVISSNEYDPAEGWTFKVVVLEMMVEIPRIHEDSLKSIKKPATPAIQ